ncbi:MAG: P22 coat - protein 5 family protein [bacterium]|nr:P22 coat - protein 5 family protein [bacterium]
MSNTLTPFIPDLFEAMDIVARELVGFIPAVSRNSNAERAAVGETLYIPITSTDGTTGDNTPAVTAPDNGDHTIDNATITITDSKYRPIRWNGEEKKGVQNSGMYSSILADQTAQQIRVLCNLIEADLGAEYVRSSRAYGTAGTAPFSSSLEDAAQVRKMLDDNGCPSSERSIVIDTAAGVKLRTLANLNQVNTSGTDATLRQGTLLDLAGFSIRESAGVQTHTKGTATGMDCTAIEPIAETTIAVDGSDSGTILIGDVLTNVTGADANKYIVASATASGSATGNITINNPGLLQATAINDELLIGNNYTANMAFHRSALQLVTRAPAMPDGGDMAEDVVQLTDPVSGLTFEFALYKQFLQNVIHVRIAWGVKLIKPEFSVILLG